MKKLIKWPVAVLAWMLYEVICDGSGVGMKERWRKIKAWVEGKA